MSDFGVKISKPGKRYVSTFWSLDSNRIVIENNKKFFTRFFAIRWSQKQIIKNIINEYIKEK